MKHVNVWLFVLLNILDASLTFVALTAGATEGNGILFFFNRASESILIWKTAVPVAVVIILALIKRLYLLKWVNVVLAIVCLWNIIAIIIGRL